jgi:glycosyltransferase involved in cell wall biosynthesis
MRIAFEIAGGDTWQAGISYIKTFVYALKHTYGDDVALYFLLPTTTIPGEISEAEGEVLEIAHYRQWTTPWIIEQAIKYGFLYDLRKTRVLKHHEIDVVFGLFLLNRYGRIPTLSWIPDFQHIHLPEMFIASERGQRDSIFLRTAKISNRVILMSQSVKKDFETFAPQYAGKARVLQGVSQIPESIYKADLKSVISLYHLPEKFVYMPNQFWKHKNHEMAFRAVKILKDKDEKVFVVCSGYPGDYRHPGYFAGLLQKISSWGIRDQVALLGMIPRNHIFMLMRQAICVLNPSLFEGFGLTVDEARSLGKRVLLSDIAAHQEQDAPKATYFDPYDSEDLAEKLSRVWRDVASGPDIELELEARQSLARRIHMCAESFMSVAREVTKRQGAAAGGL